MSNLSRRVSDLETKLGPKREIRCIWAMTAEGEAMTEEQIEAAIQDAIAAGAPANSRFITARWLAPQE